VVSTIADIAILAVAVASPFLSDVSEGRAQSTVASAESGQHPRNLQFEVASIKAVVIDRATQMRLLQSGQWKLGPRIYGDSADYLYMTIRQLVAEAYQVMTDQVVGPDWMGTEHFNVRCKMPPGSRKGDTALMLQSLLAERFQLIIHRESREQDVLALVVSERGSNLKESPSEPDLSAEETNQDSGKAGLSTSKKTEHVVSMTAGTTSAGGVIDSAHGLLHFKASRLTMAKLADLLTRTTLSGDRRVVDMTGLKGSYEVTLEIPMGALGSGSTQAAATAVENAPSPSPAEVASDPESGQLLKSLKDLGLELRKGKARVERIVVDQVERMPTEN